MKFTRVWWFERGKSHLIRNDYSVVCDGASGDMFHGHWEPEPSMPCEACVSLAIMEQLAE